MSAQMIKEYGPHQRVNHRHTVVRKDRPRVKPAMVLTVAKRCLRGQHYEILARLVV